MGPGVYATTHLATAYSYGGHDKEHCVAVIELLVDPAPYKKTDNVYVIPDDKLLFPRYLLKLRGIPNFDSVELLTYYKKLRDGLIKSKTKVNRLKADISNISDYYLETLTEHCLSISIDGVLFRCYVMNYPFTAPVLQLCYKTNSELFDKYGCYKFAFSDWTAQNDIMTVIQHAKNNVKFNVLNQNIKDEYLTLESL